MGEQLIVNVASLNQKVQFRGVARDNTPITIDYAPPLGDGQGYTSLDLLLVSLATCSASTIVTLLRQFGRTVTALEVCASGVRRTQHPTAFESIALDFAFHSADVTAEDVDKAIGVSRDAVCPVWAMVKSNVEITTRYTIVAQ